MLTGLSEGVLHTAPFRATNVAPPLRFRAAGEVRTAWLCGTGPFGPASPRRGSAAQRAGKRYERKVQKRLSSLLPGYRASPWFKYVNNEGMFFCQPDGILHCGDLTMIVEVKYSFCSDAWWQLRKLYEPVVRSACKPKNILLVLICRNYDGAVGFPEPVVVLSADSFLPSGESDCTRINVLNWRL